jgi:hypothetical protein
MKRSTTTAIAILFLLFAAFALAQEPREDPKPQQQDEAKPEPKHDAPPPRQNEVKPPRQEEEKPPREEAKPPKHEKQEENAKPPREEAKPAHEQHGEQAQEQRPGRPAGKSPHIPDEKFRASFGRQHTVVINRPVVVEGRPRFQYSGYWFELIDVWPADWAYTDDCYIDYVDGDYFLFDLRHPGVRVALFVVEM